VTTADSVVDATLTQHKVAGIEWLPQRMRSHGSLAWAILSGRRGTLWLLLFVLVTVMLGTLVWLAGRYEASQVQEKLERDAGDAVQDIRTALTRNLQQMQALQNESATGVNWIAESTQLLRDRRELLRLEWRDSAVNVMWNVSSPYQPRLFSRVTRAQLQSDVVQTCSLARRASSPIYSVSYFLPQEEGSGQEVMDLCLPLVTSGRITGYLVASYSLPNMLSDLVGPQLARGQEVSFTETDGTRLAMHGAARRGSRIFTTQQLLNLPGNTLVLRMDSRRTGPDLFPNVLTALVTVLSIALMSVVVMLGRDMRRRMLAERNLADALAFRKAMEDSLITGLQARDMQGHIRYVNPAFCEMVGYSSEELLDNQADSEAAPHGPPSSPYWPPEKVDEIRLGITQRQSSKAKLRDGVETVFVRKDGRRLPVLMFVAPLINALGEQTGWMSAFVDLTEQRRIEEMSRASQERLQATARLATVGEMASLLSHELNQPLAAISSYASGSLNMLEQSTSALGADLRIAMTRIAEQAERAGKVIKSVHNFVRRREGQREQVDPSALFEAVMPLVNLQASKLEVKVQIRVGQALPQVWCDRTMLEQVLLNLVRNGMQAMALVDVALRQLSLEVERAGESVLFSVTDCGVGITAEVAQQLFEPFFTTKLEGMGLGLSLCRTVVEQHGGILEFERRSPQGTIFRFSLPLR
jgi:two-component system sensor histidine kinase DctS